jgi:predicted anti-sigma-YlaC factor YlaD
MWPTPALILATIAIPILGAGRAAGTGSAVGTKYAVGTGYAAAAGDKFININMLR